MRPAVDEKGPKDTLLLRSCVCSIGARLNITTCGMLKEGQKCNTEKWEQADLVSRDGEVV